MIVEIAGNFITKKVKIFLAKIRIAWQNYTNAFQAAVSTCKRLATVEKRSDSQTQSNNSVSFNLYVADV